MDETDAVDALEGLGLTSYEVQVFIALQKLGTGSASDVDRITEVPRSQVYGAAERLEERGLIERQQSNPIRYRSVELDEARERLRNRYEHREDQAFAYLEDVRSKRRDADERQEDVWTLNGRESVTARATQLVRDATESVLYAGGPEAFDDDLIEELRERASNGVDVTVMSADEGVATAFDDDDVPVSTVTVPAELTPEDRQAGRILVVDDETVLLSVLGDEQLPELRTETAIWSAETGFAAVFVRLVDSWLDEHLTR